MPEVGKDKEKFRTQLGFKTHFNVVFQEFLAQFLGLKIGLKLDKVKEYKLF